MSRSGYSEDYDDCGTPLEFYRQHVWNATYGKRGQKFFVDLLAALDAMPEKRLIKEDLVAESGEVCAIGALGRKRDIDMKDIDPEDAGRVAETFDIAECLAREVVYENDEGDPWRGPGVYETLEECWVRMRKWVASQIKPAQETKS